MEPLGGGASLHPFEIPCLHLNCGGWGEREGQEVPPRPAGEELRPEARCCSSPSQLPQVDGQRRQLFYQYGALAVACVYMCAHTRLLCMRVHTRACV